MKVSLATAACLILLSTSAAFAKPAPPKVVDFSKSSRAELERGCYGHPAHRQACLLLGSDLLFRDKDPAGAKKAFRGPCSVGEAGACHNLGMIELDAGHRNIARAYWEKSCKAGYRDSCDQLQILDE